VPVKGPHPIKFITQLEPVEGAQCSACHSCQDAESGDPDVVDSDWAAVWEFMQ
jgi:hypothetical protein